MSSEQAEQDREEARRCASVTIEKLIRYPWGNNVKPVIGYSLSTSPPFLDLNSQSPFYMVIKARVISQPPPTDPITLYAFSKRLTDMFGVYSHCDSAVRTFPVEDKIKAIKLGWGFGERNFFAECDLHNDYFITIYPQETVEIGFEVPEEAIKKAGLEAGERYRIDRISTWVGWWSFGAMKDFEGVKLRRWQNRYWLEKYEREYLRQQRGENSLYDQCLGRRWDVLDFEDYEGYKQGQ